MKSMKCTISAIAVICSVVAFGTLHAVPGSAVKQPAGWDVQFQDAKCMVSTEASGAANDPPFSIKMGYLAGNQLLLMFSVSNPGYKAFQLAQNTKAWFLVDGKVFDAVGITHNGPNLILPVENNLKLQRALGSAESLGIQVQQPNASQRITVASFELANISGARDWLTACKEIGVRALPR